ncbi:50S ribosomal protein L32 [Proteocatella sphenisci]|uniref:50S ribosomal protein L32 n=1 Tax=Proteocatella sphenisci TaxID=181070 RepID=UPI00048B44E2|nr:50S ribosomal protein L32 [Proteocatella sphenisci]
MAVPKRKMAKSATRSRRATVMQISAKGLTKCPQCNELKLSHRVCPECGFYKGVEVIAK